MGILSRLLGRSKDISETDRYRKVSNEPVVSAEQTKMNRDVMEAQMQESRDRRDAESAATEAKKQDD